MERTRWTTAMVAVGTNGDFLEHHKEGRDVAALSRMGQVGPPDTPPAPQPCRGFLWSCRKPQKRKLGCEASGFRAHMQNTGEETGWVSSRGGPAPWPHARCTGPAADAIAHPLPGRPAPAQHPGVHPPAREDAAGQRPAGATQQGTCQPVLHPSVGCPRCGSPGNTGGTRRATRPHAPGGKGRHGSGRCSWPTVAKRLLSSLPRASVSLAWLLAHVRRGQAARCRLGHSPLLTPMAPAATGSPGDPVLGTGAQRRSGGGRGQRAPRGWGLPGDAALSPCGGRHKGASRLGGQ